MEEAIRKLEKMIENPSRADKIVYTRGDIEDAIEGINRLKDRIKKLEEENAELKSELSKFSEAYRRYRDYEKEELAESCYDLARENEKLKEENRKLKESLDIATKCSSKEEDGIIRLSEENRKLKEDLERYKKQYEHTMGEDS